MRRALAGLALLLASCATLPPVPSGPSAPPVSYHTLSKTFPTGLRAVVYQDPAARRATVAVSYAVGTRDEQNSDRGLAHLVEHLTFRARHGGETGATVEDNLRRAGYAHNAYTTPDSTDFMEVAAPDQLGAMLGQEAARMASPLAHVEERDFLSEREIVSAELRLRRIPGSTNDQLEVVRRLAFKDHPYGGPYLIEPAFIERLTLADARSWVQAHFRPEQATVVVVSPEAPEQVLAEIARRFGGMATRGAELQATPPVARPLPPVPEAGGGGMFWRIPGAVKHPQLWVAWTVPGASSPERLEAEGAGALALVGALANVKLDPRIRGLDLKTRVLDGAGLVAMRFTLADKGDVVALAKHLGGNLRFGPELVLRRQVDTSSAASLTRVRQIVAGLESWENPPVDEIARYARTHAEGDFYGWWNRSVRELPASYDDFLKKYLTPDRATLVLIEPSVRAPPAVEEAGAEEQGAAEEADAPAASVETAASAYQPTSEQLQKLAAPPDVQPPERHTLSTGLEVWVLPRHGHGLVDARLIVRTDLDPASRAAAHVAFAAHARDVAGTEIGRVGGSFTSSRDPESIRVAGHAPSGNLDNLLNELRRWTGEDVSALALSRAREQLVEQAEAREQRGSHPFVSAVAREAPITAEEAHAVKGSDVDSWWAHQVDPRRSVLVLSGDLVPGPELWTRLESWLGDWKREAPPHGLAASALPPSPASRRVVVVNEHGVDVALVTAMVFAPRGDAAQGQAIRVARLILAQRLRRIIREREGSAYVVSVVPNQTRATYQLHVVVMLGAEKAADAVGHITRELEALRTAPVTEAELAEALWSSALDRGSAFDTVSGSAGVLEREARLELEPATFQAEAEALSHLDAAQVQAAAKTLSIGAEEIVIVGDRSKLEQPLTTAGFAPSAP